MAKNASIKKPNPTKFKNPWRKMGRAFVRTAIFEGQEVEVMRDAKGELYFTDGRGTIRKVLNVETN